MAEELVELTAAIQHELELARSGDGYEEATVAGEIVERMVAPMLAARDAFFDQRLSDFREEYRKSSESWDRQRERLSEDRKQLRWLHAEAAWWLQLDRDEHESAEILHMWSKRAAYLEARVGELHNTIGELRAENVDLDDRRARWAEEHQKRSEELERSEASRQAWAEEAARLQQQRDEDEAPAPWDYPHEWRDNGGGDPYYNIKGDCRSCGRDFHDEIHDEPHGPRPVLPAPNAPCSCLAEGVTLPAGWVRPQCAVHRDLPAVSVHPEGGTA